ncbi:uncharacterized protein F4807DRAFT_440165 [Annulohypoxylon truncatum]|uniref:uncharacterized protein n=1 Tax=Annulohypoxylon truncatum TaxID=327061 RepID=UPI002007E1D3|nr:uncharacterized protein F4807DRAFT_440165 [Annulohypoxylon truncatum]KAI1206179.1 hypothetical protein F4807DRAFT_440165 [Annulohypoxylon truncatum]
MATQVNGEVHPSSATLSHITGYPVISDGIAYFKGNPYGQKSIELSDSAYKTFAKPVIPYLSKPYQYVSPYIKKADVIGDDTLSKIDARLPALKKPTHELWTDGKNFFLFPVRKGYETKDHVFDVYSSEYKKVGGEGLVTSGKALVSTGLVVTTEALNWVGDFLKARKVQAKEASNNATQ